MAPRNHTRMDCHHTLEFHSCFGPMTLITYPTKAKQASRVSRCRGWAP